MKRYKVIALSVGGRANNIFSAGDIVTEENFIPGRADELVAQGFLKQIDETPHPVGNIPAEEIQVEVSEPKQDEDQKQETSLIDSLKDSLGGESEKIDINAKTRKEYIKELTDLGIPFEQNASKKELFELWLSRENY
jgi:hypothetical protein